MGDGAEKIVYGVGTAMVVISVAVLGLIGYGGYLLISWVLTVLRANGVKGI